MHKKTSPDLLRQTITRLWQYNIYIQKPYNICFNFILIFKICYIIKLFLIFYRKLHILQTHNYKQQKLIKKTIFRLNAISTYKLINFRLNKKNKKLYLFCNYASRTQMYPFQINTIQYHYLYLKFKKKIRIFKYNLFFKDKLIFKSFIFNKLNSKTNKWKNFKLFIFNNLKNSNFLKKTITNNFSKWIKFTKILNQILLKPLKLKIYPPAILKKYITNIYINNFKIKKLKHYTFFYLKKNNFTKNTNFKIKNIFFNKIMLLKKTYFIKNKNGIKNKNINTHHINQTFYKILFFNKIIINKLYNLLNFCYFQIFNRIFEHKLLFFFKHINLKNYFEIILQNDFIFPKSTYFIKLLNKKIKQHTIFLKATNKFYYNFINLMPTIQTFNSIDILTKQIAIELSRTKKHWRVFKGIELILLQTFTQLKKEPISKKTNLSAIQITIAGRPNKISRTTKINFQIGKLKNSSFSNCNVFQTFATSNAQIGSFGITITATT